MLPVFRQRGWIWKMRGHSKENHVLFPHPQKIRSTKKVDLKLFYTDWIPNCLHRGWRLTVNSDCFLAICTITVILPRPSLPLLSVSFRTLLSLLAQHMSTNHLQISMCPPCLLPQPHFILAWNERLMDLFPMMIRWFKLNMIAVGWDFQIRRWNLRVQLPLKHIV